MPESGYIKRFVLHDFGIKIQSDIPKYVYLNVARNLISTPIPLFTLVVLKETEKDINEIVDLGILNVITEYAPLNILDTILVLKGYIYKSLLPMLI